MIDSRIESMLEAVLIAAVEVEDQTDEFLENGHTCRGTAECSDIRLSLLLHVSMYVDLCRTHFSNRSKNTFVVTSNIINFISISDCQLVLK